MIQIITLTSGISIGGTNYPENSLSFEIIEKGTTDEIEIKNAHGRVVCRAPYTEFMNSSSALYASPQAVITDLQTSYS